MTLMTIFSTAAGAGKKFSIVEILLLSCTDRRDTVGMNDGNAFSVLQGKVLHGLTNAGYSFAGIRNSHSLVIWAGLKPLPDLTHGIAADTGAKNELIELSGGHDGVTAVRGFQGGAGGYPYGENVFRRKAVFFGVNAFAPLVKYYFRVAAQDWHFADLQRRGASWGNAFLTMAHSICRFLGALNIKGTIVKNSGGPHAVQQARELFPRSVTRAEKPGHICRSVRGYGKENVLFPV